MARMLGRWLTGGCHCRPRDNRSWGPDCAGHASDPRQFKRIEARELDREIAEAAAEYGDEALDWAELSTGMALEGWPGR